MKWLMRVRGSGLELGIWGRARRGVVAFQEQTLQWRFFQAMMIEEEDVDPE